MSRTVQVTFDCADPGALARFWIEVLGYEYDAPPSGFASGLVAPQVPRVTERRQFSDLSWVATADKRGDTRAAGYRNGALPARRAPQPATSRCSAR
jgi:hypothetical protein